MAETTPTLLCVDPDEEARAATRDALDAGTDYRVVDRDSIAAAEDDLDDRIACVITEFDLPDGTGIDLVERVREVAPDAVCVLFTDADPDGITAESDAVVEYVPKTDPMAHDLLLDFVSHGTAVRTQTAYPLPEDESERLETVEAYLGTDPELDAALDRIATLATALFDVSMASVGIVDEHEQRFLACRGIELSPIPREDTVCTYAMLEDDVTAIEDLSEDPRFEDNDDLRDLGLRSYASANLTAPDGHVIGTLCLYDEEPRAYDEADREHLRLLAAEAMEQLELRRRLRESAGTRAQSGTGGGDPGE